MKGYQSGVEEIMTRLAERGVGTRPFFWPMHRQPVFCRIGMFAGMPSCRAPRPARVLSFYRKPSLSTAGYLLR
jgi:hypothetical protein